MSKRLKRRIFDICGLSNLSREEKISKAKLILGDSDYKQKICNQIVGASYKDIEKALKAITVSKHSEEEEEIAELERDNPEKFNPEVFVGKKKVTRLIPLTNQREVNELIHATSEPLVDKIKERGDHATYSEDEIRELLGK